MLLDLESSERFERGNCLDYRIQLELVVPWEKEESFAVEEVGKDLPEEEEMKTFSLTL